MRDKFSMTLTENIFWAKKYLVENVYNIAVVEGCNVTFPKRRLFWTE